MNLLDTLFFYVDDPMKKRYHHGLNPFLQAIARGDVFSGHTKNAYPYTIYFREGTMDLWTDEMNFKVRSALEEILSWPRPGSDAAAQAGVLWHEGSSSYRHKADGTAVGRKAFVSAAREHIEKALA